jgi:hypothetical protein
MLTLLKSKMINLVWMLPLFIMGWSSCAKRVPTILESNEQIYRLRPADKTVPNSCMRLCFTLNDVEMCQNTTPNEIELRCIFPGYLSEILDQNDYCLQNGLKAEKK